MTPPVYRSDNVRELPRARVFIPKPGSLNKLRRAILAMARFPWVNHCSLAEVAEREALIAELRASGLSIPKQGRLRDLLAKVPDGCIAVAPPEPPEVA